MDKKLGQQPAFATSAFGDDDGVYNQGISPRLYIAKGYADCAAKWARELSIETAKRFLQMKPSDRYDELIHFPMLVAKIQYMMADELLKLENE